MEGAEESGFGAGRAGGVFDIVAFLKKPLTILRLLSWIFAVVVLACITNEGYANFDAKGPPTQCIFNMNGDACRYGVAIGVIAFLAATLLLVLDLYVPSMAGPLDRKNILRVEVVFSVLWTFMWFVGFCFLTNQWSKTSLQKNGDAARASISFAFFSIFIWGSLTYNAYKRYQVLSDPFSQSYADPSSTPYAPYTAGSGVDSRDSYQQGPFTEAGTARGYQDPSY
ncbi:synaptogyrin-2-like [Lethenteron reissneri]|uniref:synaptogyrin-2-like n=1 Tax=Lethenteron reissneri TaxID=7753 RepID=UPI002AB69D87|nr:synaptogyrin-2-like [Lethenteron reissneri]